VEWMKTRTSKAVAKEAAASRTSAGDRAPAHASGGDARHVTAATVLVCAAGARRADTASGRNDDRLGAALTTAEAHHAFVRRGRATARSRRPTREPG
jgi:hypothetical protein